VFRRRFPSCILGGEVSRFDEHHGLRGPGSYHGMVPMSAVHE
jgi:hypothetical protein